MNGWFRHPIRATVRLARLAAEMTAGAAVFYWRFRGAREGARSRAQSVWLQKTAVRVAKGALDLRIAASGPVPEGGFLVCNHLSYLDIVALASLTPAVFVAKSEVRLWPFFGWFARKSGTIFVERNKPSQAPEANAQIDAALQSGALVVLFPEGTSSDGKTVLPFKSPLLEPAARRGEPLYAGWIHYELDDGDVGAEVCYWGDMMLGPHLLNLLSKREVRAQFHFARVTGGGDRKELARQLQVEVSQLKENAQSQTAAAVTDSRRPA